MQAPPFAWPSMRKSPLLRRGLINQLVSVLIALVIWTIGYKGSPLWVALLYSLCIGNLIWLFVDGGRALVSRLLGVTPQRGGGWPGWGAMIGTVTLGSVAGYTLGAGLIDTLLGYQTPTMFTSGRVLFFTFLAASLVTYFYYSRERLHTEMAAAEAARRAAAENQLKLLESQLEPHMLFNTLANLRVLIGLDPPRAQAMLDHLIAFLRATLTASRSGAQPLSAEFDRLADYLALMAVRMGPRLVVQIDLPATLRDTPVPPLLLQPLVENAIKHGLEPKVEGGRIELAARNEAGHLVLTVRDTGNGLPEDPAGAAPAGAPGAGGTHYGLAHVRERLAALYGERGMLRLQPAPGAEGGTLAIVTLPLPDTP
ncbi:MAG: histidine kinase [Burkholderiales bacterium]|nr:histidine kinase [Burkholderiales bacterium]